MSEIDQSAGSLSDELLDICKSESLSEQALREIIEKGHNAPISSYEFFRAACWNERVTEGIIRYLLDCFPGAARAKSNSGKTPLHYACQNKSTTVDMIQLLIEASPDSVRGENNEGCMPLHFLSGSSKVDEAAAVQILKLLIDKHPEAVQHADEDGCLPIHLASGSKSPEFCRVLIEAYPGSVSVRTNNTPNGVLPLHFACLSGSLATVEYLYRLNPGAKNHLSVFYAIKGLDVRDDPVTAVDIVQFLLDSDPEQELKQIEGMSPLCYACELEFDDSNIEAGIQVIKVLFDAHPEAIEENMNVTMHHRVQAFINEELIYARQAEDHRLMTTPDDNGQLPLHRALQNNVRLGSVKLLVKGNPSAIRNEDNDGAIPLHVACKHHDSARVVQYLVELDTATLALVDKTGNTVLHYACRAAKYDTVTLLLEKYEALLVSNRNVHGKLPIDLLLENNARSQVDSIQFLGNILEWRNEMENIYRDKIAELNYNASQFAASVLESGVSDEGFYLTFADRYIAEVEKLKRKYMQE